MITDALGNMMTIDDFVCFPRQSGHSVTMNVGMILSFKQAQDIPNTISSVRVLALEIGFNEKPKGKAKETSITKFQNLIKIDKKTLPNDFIVELNKHA